MGFDSNINSRRNYETAKETGAMSPEQIKLDAEIQGVVDSLNARRVSIAQGRAIIRNHARSWKGKGIDISDLYKKVNTWKNYEQYGDWLRNQLRPELSTQVTKAVRQKELSGKFVKRQEGYEAEWAEYQKYLSKLKPNETDKKYSLKDLRDLRVKLREVMRHAEAPNTKDDELYGRAYDLNRKVDARASEVLNYGINEIKRRVDSGEFTKEQAYDALSTASESITDQDRMQSLDLGGIARRLEDEKDRYGKKYGSMFIATIDEKSE